MGRFFKSPLYWVIMFAITYFLLWFGFILPNLKDNIPQEVPFLAGCFGGVWVYFISKIARGNGRY